MVVVMVVVWVLVLGVGCNWNRGLGWGSGCWVIVVRQSALLCRRARAPNLCRFRVPVVDASQGLNH